MYSTNYRKGVSNFLSNLIGKLTIAFLTGQSRRVLKSWYTDGRLEQGFRRSFADRLKQKLSFDFGAGYTLSDRSLLMAIEA